MGLKKIKYQNIYPGHLKRVKIHWKKNYLKIPKRREVIAKNIWNVSKNFKHIFNLNALLFKTTSVSFPHANWKTNDYVHITKLHVHFDAEPKFRLIFVIAFRNAECYFNIRFISSKNLSCYCRCIRKIKWRYFHIFTFYTAIFQEKEIINKKYMFLCF